MARSRNIKPGLFKNELLGDSDPLYTIMFAGLWCLADKKGRLEDRPKRIKAEIFPYRFDLDPSMILAWLNDNLFINRYSIDGKNYIQIKKWESHQSPHHKEINSVIPEFNDSIKSHKIHGLSNDQSKHASSIAQERPKKSASTPLIPDSLNLIPDSLNLIPDSLNSDSGFPKKHTPKAEKNENEIKVLEYLNIKTGKNYKPVKSNLSLISQRLKEGHTVSECMWVIDSKTKEWLTDENFNKFLRPATLFNASKFNNYIGEKGSSRPLTEKEKFHKNLDGADTDDFIEGEYNAEIGKS